MKRGRKPKLTLEQKQEILALAKNRTAKSLAEEYKVSAALIYHVVRQLTKEST